MATKDSFVGRKKELQLLSEAYLSKSSKIIAIHGRRRIGKSYLLKYFSEKKQHLYFEGLEKGSTRDQLFHFTNTLREQTKDPLLGKPFTTWNEALTFLTERCIKDRKEKVVLIFDELQWLAVGRGSLISLFKYFWDNNWINQKVVLILCGSISSFMIHKVIKSRALYGRISMEICLQEMLPKEAFAMLKTQFTPRETLDTILCLGAIPQYLNEIESSLSVSQNIIRQCFHPSGFFFDEYEKIFYSQFKEHRIYERIVKALSLNSLEFLEIAKRVNLPSGGGLSRYLENLALAQFIIEVTPFGSKSNTKFKRYQLSDSYLAFYLKFIAPNKRRIQSGAGRQLFEKIQKENLDIFLGLALERFCLRHASLLAEAMNFGNHFLSAAPYFERKKGGYQIDLLFERTDNIIVLAEIKYSKNPISTKIIPEMDRKISLFKTKSKDRIQKALISLAGPDQALRDSEYFDYHLSGLEVF